MLRFNSLFTLIILILTSCQVSALSINGKIVDQNENTGIAGANVTILDTQFGAASNDSGEFSFSNLAPGKYIVAVSYIGYKIAKKTIILTTTDKTVKIILQPELLKTQQIVISASRAVNRQTPVAFTDISAQEVKNKYWSQEIPLILDEIPGVYSYSYTGSGLGYAEVKIRGFDATRVGVTINDVPLNDPLDHITYFYDLPDISANIQDIQVQRGVANSLYGTGAFAGSVNIRTETAGNDRYINYTTGLGSYNTQKHTAAFGSGLVDNTYSFYGRFSRVKSDGYRDMSDVDSWSYFFSASRYDEKLTTTVNLFGGPMKAHFAWNGITREELNTNRKLNYDQYKNAADNFNQPHYQLINEWMPSDAVKLTSTLFHVKGDGYYEQFVTDKKFQDYNMENTELNGIIISRSDLVRQKWVDKKQYGWIPRLEIKHGKNTLSVGSELSYFTSHHWGEVVWGSVLPAAAEPGHIYYQHDIDKNTASVYVNELFEMTPGLFLKADLQYQHITFDFKQDKLGAFYGHQFKLNYNFLTPRLGLNYNINDQLNVFGNFSMAKREPKDGDIYDADDPDAQPLFKNINPEKGIYKNPYIKEETLYDFETGVGFRTDLGQLKVNAFWMNFNNEIVPTGGITDDGYPIYGNADKSVHRGVELDTKTRLPLKITLNANMSFSDNYFVNYTEYLWNQDYSGYLAFNRNNKSIANFPDMMANARISRNIGPVYASLHAQHIGRIYLDNTQDKNLSIAPRNIVNFSAQVKIPEWFGPLQLTAAIFINNMFNKKYELSGYTWEGIGYYIPAAERNYFFTLQTQI